MSSNTDLRIPVAPGMQAFIFDLDGTLADTMPAHWAAWDELFAELGVRCPRDFLVERSGMPTAPIVVELNALLGTALHPEEFAREKNSRVTQHLRSSRAIEPVAEIARRYHGEIALAIASGGNRENVEVTLEAIGMRHLFSVVITADDAVAPKPSPEIFLAVARELGVDPARCQVFEDAEMGLVAARAAGMIATDVRPFLKE